MARDSEFRYDARSQRARWNVSSEKGKSPSVHTERLNEGKPIVISHYVPDAFQKNPSQFFFIYSFPLTPKQEREGYGSLLFVGPSPQIASWLRVYGQSFYETCAHRTVSLPSVFRALVDPVSVPFSDAGSVCREQDTLVYRVGNEAWPLVSCKK